MAAYKVSHACQNHVNVDAYGAGNENASNLVRKIPYCRILLLSLSSCILQGSVRFSLKVASNIFILIGKVLATVGTVHSVTSSSLVSFVPSPEPERAVLPFVLGTKRPLNCCVYMSFCNWENIFTFYLV